MPKKENNKSPGRLDRQVERLHREMVELVKKYQFRDRNRVSCHGISVTQCYILETMKRFGDMSMTELADRMYLSVSTITRVIAPLLEKKYLSRERDAHDARFKVIRLTAKGSRLATEMWRDVLESEKDILSRIPAKDRESLIKFLRDFNVAVAAWRESCDTG